MSTPTPSPSPTPTATATAAAATVTAGAAATASATATAGTATAQPPPILAGLKVLDFTQYVAGPTVTRLMAAMGAYVIKVEQAPGGDLLRLGPWLHDGRSTAFVQHNRGKHSLAIDLDDERGLEVV